jgi:hypothetical protein
MRAAVQLAAKGTLRAMRMPLLVKITEPALIRLMLYQPPLLLTY